MTFLVELYLRHPQRRATVSRAREAPRSGMVTLRRSIYVPADEMLLLLYDARSAAATKHALTRAEIPFDRIVEAIEDSPDTFSESGPWSTTVGLAMGGPKEPARCGPLEKRLAIAVTGSDLGSTSPSPVTTSANSSALARARLSPRTSPQRVGSERGRSR